MVKKYEVLLLPEEVIATGTSVLPSTTRKTGKIYETTIFLDIGQQAAMDYGS